MQLEKIKYALKTSINPQNIPEVSCSVVKGERR
jgi:hypothetical protein